MENDQAINDYCQKVSDLYTKNIGCYGNPEAGKIGALWSFLLDALGDMTFDKRVYVLSRVKHHSSKHCIELALGAIPDCATIEHARMLWPFVPKTRKKERSVLLRMTIKLAKDKDEIVSCLEEFGYLDSNRPD